MNTRTPPFGDMPATSDDVEALVGRLADEFLAACERGDAPSPEDLAEQYPAVGDIIRRTFPTLLAMRHLDEPTGELLGNVGRSGTESPLSTTAFAPPSARVLGDFLILGEIGRGGMGVVYEAEQISLGRRVALKVLPMAAFLDPRRLQRFKQEAQAAAILQHSNIVRVFCVGCERGVHYFAMELVQGVTLAQLITQLQGTSTPTAVSRLTKNAASSEATHTASRHSGGATIEAVPQQAAETQPLGLLSTQREGQRLEYFRSTARLFEQVARAVHYAHEQGVIHRDLKPSNLLIDELGKPWVTDFGLAQVPGDASLTITGDVLGTLRYMSPEQADGQKLLDHRTDVYSLGVTLYEMLVLRPVITGEDRQGVLRQLEFEGPASLRSIDAAVPKDLETIVLKTIAQRPEDRYRTAGELAEDLQRFLDRRPIQARRISTVGHVYHWVRRRRLWAALLAALFVTTLTLAIGGPIVAVRHARMAREYKRVADAESHARQMADNTSDDLLKLLTDSVTNALVDLENSPGTGLLRERLLRETINICQRLLARSGERPDVRFEVARAFGKIAFVMDLETDPPEARRLGEQGIQLLTELRREAPKEPDYQYELGIALCYLGNRVQPSDLQHSFELSQRGLELLDRLANQYPDESRYWSDHCYCRLFHGNKLQAIGRRKEAGALYRLAEQSAAMHHQQRPGEMLFAVNWAYAKSHVAHHCRTTGRHDEALRELRLATDLCESAMSYIEQYTRLRIGYAEVLRNLADVLIHLEQYAEAEKHLRSSIERFDAIVDGFPKSKWARMSRGWAYLKYAELLTDLGRVDEAIEAYRIHLQNWDYYPDARSENRGQAALALHRLGWLLWPHGRQDEATTCFREALSIPQDSRNLNWELRRVQILILANCPDISLRRPSKALEIARFHDTPVPARPWWLWGLTQYRVNDWHGARQSLEESIDRDEDNPMSILFLAMACHQQGDREAARKNYGRALRLIEKPMGGERKHVPYDIQAARDEAEALLGITPFPSGSDDGTQSASPEDVGG